MMKGTVLEMLPFRVGRLLAPWTLVLVPSAAGAQAGHLFLAAETFESGPLQGVAVGDLDGDGIDDVIAVGGDAVTERTLYAFRGTETGLERFQTLVIGGLEATRGDSIGIGDVTGDDRPDVLVADTRGLLLLEQEAAGTFAAPVMLTSSRVILLRVADLDDDGDDDVVAIDWGTDVVDVFLQGPSGLGSPTTYDVIHQGYDDLDVGDLDGDGLVDIVVMSGQGITENLGVLLQRAGGFTAPIYASVPDRRTPSGLGVGDLTGDGLDDVVVTFQFERDFGLLPFDGNGFDDATVRMIPGAVGVATDIRDLTGDGLDDVLFSGSKPLTQTADGTLVELDATPGGGAAGPHSTGLGDVNGDGRVDLVVPESFPGAVNVLYGTAVSLSVTGLAVPDPVLATLDSTFTLEVRNDGPDDASAVTLTVTPDTELRGVNLEPASGSCDSQSCELGALAAGASTTVTFTAYADDPGTFGAEVAVGAYNFDADASNDSARSTVTVLPAADLSVGLGRTYRRDGSTDGALVILGNRGPHAATAAQVVVDLESGLIFHGYEGGDGAAPPAMCSSTTRSITCDIGELPLVDVFDNPEATQIHLLLSGAGALRASIEAETGDPDPSNNDAELTLREASGTPGDADVPSGGGNSDNEGSCGCRIVGNQGNGWLLMLVTAAVALAMRRRLTGSHPDPTSIRRSSV